MITLFNNIKLTPDVAPFKANRFVLVGKSVVSKYEELLVDPKYNNFDDRYTIGIYSGSYLTAEDLINDLSRLSGNDRLEIISSADTYWQIYVSALKLSLPKLDVDMLYLLLVCQWYQITYVESVHKFGIINNLSAQLSATQWINRPSKEDAQLLFDSALPINGIDVDPLTLPWEFQLATFYAYPENSKDIQDKINLLMKSFVHDMFCRDRALSILKNLPDLENYTGIPYDVDQDFSTYISQFPILNKIFQYYYDNNKDITQISDDDLRLFFKDYVDNHMSKVHDVSTDFYRNLSQSNFNSWFDLFDPVQFDHAPFIHEISMSYNFMGYANAAILNYISVNRKNFDIVSKFAIR